MFLNVWILRQYLEGNNLRTDMNEIEEKNTIGKWGKLCEK